MTVLIEGEVVVVLDDTKLVECKVISFYPYNGTDWVVLKAISTGKEYRRPKTLFTKPDRSIKIHSR